LCSPASRRANVGLGSNAWSWKAVDVIEIGAASSMRRSGPCSDRAKQLERQRIGLIALGSFGERFLCSDRITCTRMQDSDPNKNACCCRSGRCRRELSQLRSGEAWLTKSLEPTRKRMTNGRIVIRRKRSKRELHRKVDLRITRSKNVRELLRSGALFRGISHRTRKLDARTKLRLFRNDSLAT